MIFWVFKVVLFILEEEKIDLKYLEMKLSQIILTIVPFQIVRPLLDGVTAKILFQAIF